MATTVWKRVKVNVCELCGRVMDVGEPYTLHHATAGDGCDRCRVDFERQEYGALAVRGRQ